MITLTFLLLLISSAIVLVAYAVAAALTIALTVVGLVVALVVAVIASIGLAICGATGVSGTTRWVNTSASVVRLEPNPTTARTKYTAIIAADLGDRTEHIRFPTDIRFATGTRLRCTVKEHTKNDELVSLKITDLSYADSY